MHWPYDSFSQYWCDLPSPFALILRKSRSPMGAAFGGNWRNWDILTKLSSHDILCPGLAQQTWETHFKYLQFHNKRQIMMETNIIWRLPRVSPSGRSKLDLKLNFFGMNLFPLDPIFHSRHEGIIFLDSFWRKLSEQMYHWVMMLRGCGCWKWLIADEKE